jgi:cytochrome P450
MGVMPARPPAVDGRLGIDSTRKLLQDPLAALDRWRARPEDVIRVTVAGRQFCLGASPAVAEQVLGTDAGNYRKADIVRENLETLQGDSLVLLEGEQWEQRRQTLEPGFTGPQVQAVGSLTTDCARAAVERWPGPITPGDHLRPLSLTILTRALFGTALEGGQQSIREAADDILARMNPQTLSAFLPEWVPTPTNLRFKRAVQTVQEAFDTAVAAASPEPEEYGLLGRLLAADLNPAQVRDELIALLFAGYDSTATALSVSLALIAERPAVQARLRDELAGTLNGEVPTPADLTELSFLNAVIRESLRLYPPQYLLFRQATEACRLGGYHIDAGQTVVVSPWCCHRDPEFWERPRQFRPERWDRQSTRPRFAYVPYGGGPRHCLGHGLAAQTLRLVVAVICQQRRLHLPEPLAVDAGPTLSPDSLTIQLTPDPC